MKQRSDTCCVITTINQLSKTSVPYWAELFDRVYIVLDDKSPDPDIPHSNVVYVNPANYSFPRNHYAVKMLGYLAAYQDGYLYCFETDDDNYPMDIVYQHQRAVATSLGEYFNVFAYAGYSGICPRGFPPMHSLDASVMPIDDQLVPAVTQWWCDDDPDVWAFYRMHPNYLSYIQERKKELGSRVASGWPVQLSRGSWGACNTQMTLLTLDKSLMPLYYLPITCTPRASDILRGWRLVAELTSFTSRWAFHYAGPGVYQTRNPHDFQRDMVEEINLLDRFTKQCRVRFDIGDMIRLGHCTPQEQEFYEMYLEGVI